jgi:hypothetical protein
LFRKNVASQNIPFLLIKAVDGTALTGATVTAYRCIDGAAQAAVTGSVTEKANGQYLFAPSQADMNGNNIGFLFTASSAIPVHFTIITTAADPTNATTFGLTNLDAAITTRNATTPPTVTAIRTEMDSNSTKLANLDTTVSSRSTYAGGAVASVTAGVTVTTNNDKSGYSLSVTPPTAAQVRTEMDSNSTKLANLDATVSSRLAPAGTLATVTNLTNAPTSGDLTATMKASVTTAATAATPTVSVSDSARVIAIKAQTDQLVFAGGKVNANATASVDTTAIANAVDTKLSTSHGSGGWGSSATGNGAIPVTITVESNSLPADGVAVYITTDSAGVSLTAGTLFTDAFGVVNFLLDPGTYYVWKQRAGINFTNPETIVVTA